MNARDRIPATFASNRDGFVLVGVAMFILVLTILGLSLFSLSSFESQFFERSYRGSRAFYEAAGGIDRARWALTTTESLGTVTQFLPPGTVAQAYQDKGGGFIDSVGLITWGGNDVLIRVITTNRDVRQTVQAQFIPSQESDHYKRLMTLSGWGAPDTGLWVRIENDPGDIRHTQTWLGGQVWQNAPSPGPPCALFQQVPLLFSWRQPPGGVPAPDVSSYFTAGNRWNDAADVPSSGTMTYSLSGLGQPNNVGFFKTPSGGALVSLLVGAKDPLAIPPDLADVQINVQGTVVWMFDRGFISGRRVQVTGGPTDLLVLVANSVDQSNINRFTGLGFFGGLNSPFVPVILVASEIVKIVHDVEPAALDQSSFITYLSIYARSVELMGPPLPHTMTLLHPTNAAPDLLGGAVNRLHGLGLLPNIDAGENHALPMRPGTWHQVAQNN